MVIAGPSLGPGVRGHNGCAEGLGVKPEGGQRTVEPSAGLSPLPSVCPLRPFLMLALGALCGMRALLLVPGQCAWAALPGFTKAWVPSAQL